MNERRVIRIDPTQNEALSVLQDTKKRKRVCAYARVSTNQQDQINSYNAQITEYTKKINENPNWELVEMYADEGISGTSMKKRTAFNKMVEAVRNGNIDLILTKSISRFARNTVDCLSLIREFRNRNVEVFFEKENLNSANPNIDFVLTMFSSIAQEESRNISDNVKWGIRKRFQEGKVLINTRRFLGYEKDSIGTLVINPEQAKTVRMIFNLYVAGLSLNEISKHLTENKIINGSDVVLWKAASIRFILKNEKYCGDVLLQKRVTIDYLSHKSVENKGQAPQYHIVNNHDPIIRREVFEIVQQLLVERKDLNTDSRFRHIYPLSGLVICNECGRLLHRNHYVSKDVKRIVLTCKNHYRDKRDCSSLPIDNQALEEVCLDAIKQLQTNHSDLIEQVIDKLKVNLEVDSCSDTINQKRERIHELEIELKKLIHVKISASTIQNDSFIEQTYNDKKNEIKVLQDEIDGMLYSIKDNLLNKTRLDKINDYLKGNNILSREAFLLLFVGILVIDPTHIILCTCKKELSISEVHECFGKIKSYKPIIDKTYISKNEKNIIHYKIIVLEDEKHA